MHPFIQVLNYWNISFTGNVNKLLCRGVGDNAYVYSLPEDFHFHLLSFSAFASVYCVRVCVYTWVYKMKMRKENTRNQ